MTRIAVLDRELCNPKKCNYSCMHVCPKNRAGEKCIVIGKHGYPEINESMCIGCGLCVKKCDFRALKVVNLPEALKENPIIQFGPNSFRLFRLQVPVRGVVGLLGENGTGKTTALKILSGHIKPNLGEFDKEIKWKDIIKTCGGNEIRAYIKKLADKKIKTAYKPQQVDHLIKRFSDTNELNIDKKIAKKLKINIDDKELRNLSGGELQKISIALTLSQDADMYYLDEPSSFLDVRERLRVARIIREFALDRFVMVIEHDLAMLDFIADYKHIFYGEPGAFGIVSKPYSAKQGINTFLSGYIKEDNVRIREPITFDGTFQQNESKEILVSFGDIKKEFDNFSLFIEAGDIHKNEVLGVFGANALGKTTFAKILAGIIRFEGEIDKKVKISYKPQYLSNIEYNGTVFDLLSVVKNPRDKEFGALIRKLGLENLLQKSVKNLSGGELQRVAIASCLGRDCDLYMLDEPSAYLDVDQRMALAKIRRGMEKTFVVIDHDILFLSYIADRCMLFSGEPGKYGKGNFYCLKDGLNIFLKDLNITFRRDNETKRLKANKPGSVKDREQKSRGQYFTDFY